MVDLTSFDPTLPLPGWDGKKASQKSNGKFPQDRDLQVLGHRSKTWTGGGYIRGGRNVQWIGGAYTSGPWLRNFKGDASIEGVLTRAPFSPNGSETGDSFVVNPDSTTFATSRIFILNCRAENIDGYFDGAHGDLFQLSSQYQAPSGFSSCPREVTIERFTGTTGYQGLFLPNQHFDDISDGYEYSCRKVTLIDVNLRKSRLNTYYKNGQVRGRINLIFVIDVTAANRGDQPYPKTFTNVYVEPFANEGLDGCIYPTASSGQTSSFTGSRIVPDISSDGLTATYPSNMLITGSIQLGPPPGGDFAKAADSKNIGGLNIPGIGYKSPGYL